MSASKPQSSFTEKPVSAVHLTYECVSQIHNRESDSYRYEVACAVTYPVAIGHLSIKVTGQQTYRNAAAKEVSFTRHETGASTYVDLFESEHLEVRVVEQDGSYAKALYYAHGQELTEQYMRGMVSTIQRIDTDAGQQERQR